MDERELCAKLTPRQTECLRLASMGYSSSKIAKSLEISPRTVDDYIAAGCARLGVKTRVEAVALAIRAGLF